MSTNVGLSTPWAREAWAALGAERQAAIEAAVPEGHFLSLGAGRTRGDWTCSLMRGDMYRKERSVEVAVVRHRPTFEVACWQAIHAGKEAARCDCECHQPGSDMAPSECDGCTGMSEQERANA